MEALILQNPCSEIGLIRKILRPVGPWRFLTPIEVAQPGDLFRVVSRDDEERLNAYEAGWTVYIGTRPEAITLTSHPNTEIIRAMDETAFTVPMYANEETEQ